MLLLYWIKATCSLAPHIVLEELGLPYENVRIMPSKLEQPAEWTKHSPLGTVPLLIMENGEPLSETAVILQYLADLKPEKRLAPHLGTLERLRLQEVLNFIATEIHKGFGPLFNSDDVAVRAAGSETLGLKLDVLVARMGAQEFVMPWGYTVADAYLFTVMSWAATVKLDLSRWPALVAHLEGVRARPATMAALRAEHLTH